MHQGSAANKVCRTRSRRKHKLLTWKLHRRPCLPHAQLIFGGAVAVRKSMPRQATAAPAAKGKIAHRLCNLVHCCRAAIGAMASEPYCRSMLDRPSDEDVSRQIFGVFMRHRIPATGTLQRNYFFEVRDGDFQRGINKAVANNWITIDLRNRYRYQLTTTGYAAGRVIDPVLGA